MLDDLVDAPAEDFRLRRAEDLTFRRWRQRFPAIFCGRLTRGVGAMSLRPGHLPLVASLPRHAGWCLSWEPGPSDSVTPVNSSTRPAPCLNAPGFRPGHAKSLRRPHSRHCRQLSPPTTRLPKNPLPLARPKPNIDTGGEFPLADHGPQAGQAGVLREAVSPSPRWARQIRHQCQHSCHQPQSSEREIVNQRRLPTLFAIPGSIPAGSSGVALHEATCSNALACCKSTVSKPSVNQP